MNLYTFLTFLIGASAIMAYLNHRYVKMPFVIGLFFQSTFLLILIMGCKFLLPEPYLELQKVVAGADISRFILGIMLGFLLFAGALHTNWVDIRERMKPIMLLAVGGMLASTLLVASLLYAAFALFHSRLDFIHCLLFGTLISATDPIAVLGILKKANVSKKTETIIVGESLFNDGVAIVLFTGLLETMQSGSSSIHFDKFALIFVQEAVGGSLLGILFGYALHKLLKSIDHYETEVLLTIAFVMAGYGLCSFFHLSGALAMVIMGLFVGNFEPDSAMSETTRDYVHKFWELADVILNAILFILVALVLILIDFKVQYVLLGAISILAVLFSRVVVVYIPVWIAPKWMDLRRSEAKIVVWGGLRGGLSIALVLSLPWGEAKNILLILTYSCVLFSILVQGLTVGKVAQGLNSSP